MDNYKPIYQNLALHKVPTHFRGRSKFVVQLWWLVQGSLFAWSPQIFMVGEGSYYDYLAPI